MNTLSILASYGALVVVFQDGAFSDVLGFQPLGFIEASLPIVMFCVLFGLSMDYEVFLLSRVKEAYDSGADNAPASRSAWSARAASSPARRPSWCWSAVVHRRRHRPDQGARTGDGHRRAARRDARARPAGTGHDALAGRLELVGAAARPRLLPLRRRVLMRLPTGAGASEACRLSCSCFAWPAPGRRAAAAGAGGTPTPCHRRHVPEGRGAARRADRVVVLHRPPGVGGRSALRLRVHHLPDPPRGAPAGYLAHFAITDIDGQRFSHQARLSAAEPQVRSRWMLPAGADARG